MVRTPHTDTDTDTGIRATAQRRIALDVADGTTMLAFVRAPIDALDSPAHAAAGAGHSGDTPVQVAR